MIDLNRQTLPLYKKLDEKNKKNLEFLTDMEVLKGLYLTLDIKKIKQNCRLYYIEILNSVNPINISKRDNKAIITFRVDSVTYIQCLVKDNLMVKQLKTLDKNIFPDDIKDFIKQAYYLTKRKTLRDMLI